MPPDGTDHPADLRLVVRGSDQAVTDVAGVHAGRGRSARPTVAPSSYRSTAVGDDQLSLRPLQMQGTLGGTHAERYGEYPHETLRRDVTRG